MVIYHLQVMRWTRSLGDLYTITMVMNHRPPSHGSPSSKRPKHSQLPSPHPPPLDPPGRDPPPLPVPSGRWFSDDPFLLGAFARPIFRGELSVTFGGWVSVHLFLAKEKQHVLWDMTRGVTVLSFKKIHQKNTPLSPTPTWRHLTHKFPSRLLNQPNWKY